MDREARASEAVEIARMRLQGLDQFAYDRSCCCIISCLSWSNVGHQCPIPLADHEEPVHIASPLVPLDDFRYLHVGINSYYKSLSAKWFPIISLDASEIDLHDATVSAFEKVNKSPTFEATGPCLLL